MRTFIVTDAARDQHTIAADEMVITSGTLMFYKGGVISAAFALWGAVIEEGVSTVTPAPPPLTEPDAVTALRESLRDRGAVTQ
jgi:hypothetical protein